MRVVEKKLDDLIPYAKNAKRHDETQIANVAESIRRFGFVQPIVVDKNSCVIIGHCRLSAAKKLGMNILMALFFQVAILLPPSTFYEGQAAFASTLGSAPRILIASLAAYVVGDFANDKVFAGMKARYSKEMKGFGFRAILSSLVGEACDSAIFIPIAFIGVMPPMAMLKMGLAQIVIKVGYEVVILPVTTLICKAIRRHEIQSSR